MMLLQKASLERLRGGRKRGLERKKKHAKENKDKAVRSGIVRTKKG